MSLSRMITSFIGPKLKLLAVSLCVFEIKMSDCEKVFLLPESREVLGSILNLGYAFLIVNEGVLLPRWGYNFNKYS